MLGPAFTMDKVPGPVCFQDEILIIKSLAIDGLATNTKSLSRDSGVAASARPKIVFFRNCQRVVVELWTCNSAWTMASQ